MDQCVGAYFSRSKGCFSLHEGRLKLISAENMQTVFRIRPGKPKTRITALDDAQAIAKSRRRTHKKSRLGCRNCKVRRVKCDESREFGCGNCQQHGIDCDYLSSNQLILSSKSSSTTQTPSSALTPVSARTPTSLQIDEYNYDALPTRQSSPCAKLYPSLRFMSSLVYETPEDIAPVLQVMSYFELVTCSTVTSTSGLAVFKDALLALSHHCDYLMHAMLGISAAHLCELDSIAQDSTQVARFRKTESYHWHHALRGYRAALATEAKSETADSLITVCMLIGCHSFYMPNPSEISFVDAAPSERRAKLQWLQVVNGFVPVMRHIGAFLGTCAWSNVFNEAGAWDDFCFEEKFGVLANFQRNQFDFEIFSNFLGKPAWKSKCGRPPEKRILTTSLDLCEIDPADRNSVNGPYKSALKDLFALLQVREVSMRDFAFLMAFQGRLNGEFTELLLKRERRALLIMLHWLVLLEKVQLWWTKARAQCEANAILRYLNNDPDPLVQALLERPRAAFGFEHGQMDETFANGSNKTDYDEASLCD